MTTEQTYALLALRVYDTQLVNKPLPPPSWTEILPQPIGTDGFAYAVYKNPDTNEVVTARGHSAGHASIFSEARRSEVTR